MKEFFQTARFKVIVIIVIGLIVGMLIAVSMDGSTSPVSSISEFFLSPFQNAASWISDKANSANDSLSSRDDYQKKIDELERQVSDLRENMVDYESIKQENEQYKKYLELKSKEYNPQFEAADVISRDPNDPYYSFTINKGSFDGIEKNQPVVYGVYLVGVISEVGPIESKVRTIYDPKNNVSAYEINSREAGVIIGSIESADQGLCRMSYLTEEKSTGIQVGGIVCTSGVGGIYPKDILVGEVIDVKEDTGDANIYAVVKPYIDAQSIRDVFVITNYDKDKATITTQP